MYIRYPIVARALCLAALFSLYTEYCAREQRFHAYKRRVQRAKQGECQGSKGSKILRTYDSLDLQTANVCKIPLLARALGKRARDDRVSCIQGQHEHYEI